MTHARHLAALAALWPLLIVVSARAELRVTAGPVLGPGTPVAGSWLECGVRIDNDDTRIARGLLELTSTPGYASGEKLVTRAPFSVPAGGVATVRLPSRGFLFGGGPLALRVLGQKGDLVTTLQVSAVSEPSPFLLDMSEPPRLSAALRDATVSVTFDPFSGHAARSGPNSVLLAGSLRVDPSTGDPVMPERAAGYASTTLVVVRSEQLARVGGVARDALASYVLAGGSLAIVITRPDDQRNPPISDLVGGEVLASSPPSELRKTPGQAIRTPESRGQSPQRGHPASVVWPSDEVAKSLSGYVGANLYPTLFGAAASYGLGEVHLLGFDPTVAPGVDDAWVQSRMVDLVRHAWDRRRYVVSPHAASVGTFDVSDIRKELDPNESGRWSIVVAAVLLMVYAVLAGPLNFARASKGGRPLRALRHLPFWSLGAFFVIVVLGVAAKGWKGKARHLSFVEAGAGMSKAGVRRYRGFFASASRSLTVRATDPGSVLDAATESLAGASRSLLVDRDGVKLDGLSTVPWETVVVREDGFVSLGGGVSMVPEPDGDMTIANRTARDLRAVLVVTPEGKKRPRRAYVVDRLRDGTRVRVSEGREVAFSPWKGSRVGLTHSDLAAIREDLDKESRGLYSAWAALGEACGSNVEWWPDDVPVLLAQVDGGEGRSTDSGLVLDRDRVLLRVVGFGGVP